MSKLGLKRADDRIFGDGRIYNYHSVGSLGWLEQILCLYYVTKALPVTSTACAEIASQQTQLFCTLNSGQFLS